MQTKTENTKKLVESALLVAAAVVLSVFKIADLPYGGSVTLASMFPIVLIAYRHGLAWGMGAGLSYAVLQQLLGLKSLSYVTTWQSVLAVIFLDYIFAFAVLGLGGIFRGKMQKQSTELAMGSFFVCVLRYIFHVISGATVWAGISIPTGAAMAYSLIYNATYMVPETIVLVLVAYYLGSVLEFRKPELSRLQTEENGGKTADLLGVFTGLIGVGAVIADVALIFAHMQDPESGEFNIQMLKVENFVGSFWMTVVIVSVVALAIGCILCTARRNMIEDAKNTKQ